MDEDYYKILQVPEWVNEEELEKAYLKLVSKFHPDRNPRKPWQKWYEVKRAWFVVGSPQRRQAYDIRRKKRLRDRANKDRVLQGRIHKPKDDRARSGPFFKFGRSIASRYASGRGSEEKVYIPDDEDPTDANGLPSSAEGAKREEGAEVYISDEDSTDGDGPFSSAESAKREEGAELYISDEDPIPVDGPPSSAGGAKREKGAVVYVPDEDPIVVDGPPSSAGGAKRGKSAVVYVPDEDPIVVDGPPSSAGGAKRGKSAVVYVPDEDPRDADGLPSSAGGAKRWEGAVVYVPDEDPRDADGLLSSAGGAKNGEGAQVQSTGGNDNAKVKQFVRDLHLTLEEVATGGSRTRRLYRSSREDGGKTEESADLTIYIQPGWKAGTKIIWRKRHQPWTDPAEDIVYIIRDKPHDLFTRDGNDIRYTAEVTSEQVANGSSIDIPTLTDVQFLLIPSPDLLLPKRFRRFKGHGLPIHGEPSKKGDLIVTLTLKSPALRTQNVDDIVYTIPDD